MKKLHRFLVHTPLPSAQTYAVNNPTLSRQMSTVLKLTIGETFILFTDGGDDEVVTLQSIDNHQFTVERVRTVKNEMLPPRALIAAISIPKGSTVDTIVQKLTELGVRTIIPIISTRTVKSSVRITRLQAISDEALEQCGGNTRVGIHDPMTLATCLSQFPASAIVFHPDGMPLQSTTKKQDMVMYIGPEGGWDKQDIELFEQADAAIVTLGPRILRSDTATIVGAYQLLWD